MRHLLFLKRGVWVSGFLFFLVLIFWSPDMALALTLGKIHVKSVLGKPFDAKIDVSVRSEGETQGLGVVVATTEDYRLMGLERPPWIGSFVVQLDGKGSDRSVRIRSEREIQEPFFNFLLKFSVGRGVHFRNYPVFLEINQQPEVKAMKASAASSGKSGVGSAGAATYGPVKPGDTLRGIAGKYLPSGYTLSQVMAAFWSVNKKAFPDGNTSSLPRGVVLKIPSLGDISAFSDQDAVNLLRQHQTTPPHLAAKPSAQKTVPVVSPTTAKGGGKSPAPKSVPAVLPTPPEDVSAKDGGKPSIQKAIPAATLSAPEAGMQVPVAPSGEGGGGSAVPSAAKDAVAPLSSQAGGPPQPAPEAPVLPTKLTEKISQIDSISDHLVAVNKDLKESDAVRRRLQGQVTALESRIVEMERASQQKPWFELGQGWLVPSAIGAVLALLGGFFVLSNRRRKQDSWISAPEEEEVTPSPSLSPSPSPQTPDTDDLEPTVVYSDNEEDRSHGTTGLDEDGRQFLASISEDGAGAEVLDKGLGFGARVVDLSKGSPLESDDHLQVGSMFELSPDGRESVFTQLDAGGKAMLSTMDQQMADEEKSGLGTVSAAMAHNFDEGVGETELESFDEIETIMVSGKRWGVGGSFQVLDPDLAGDEGNIAADRGDGVVEIGFLNEITQLSPSGVEEGLVRASQELKSASFGAVEVEDIDGIEMISVSEKTPSLGGALETLGLGLPNVKSHTDEVKEDGEFEIEILDGAELLSLSATEEGRVAAAQKSNPGLLGAASVEKNAGDYGDLETISLDSVGEPKTARRDSRVGKSDAGGANCVPEISADETFVIDWEPDADKENKKSIRGH